MVVSAKHDLSLCGKNEEASSSLFSECISTVGDHFRIVYTIIVERRRSDIMKTSHIAYSWKPALCAVKTLQPHCSVLHTCGARQLFY